MKTLSPRSAATVLALSASVGCLNSSITSPGGYELMGGLYKITSNGDGSADACDLRADQLFAVGAERMVTVALSSSGTGLDVTIPDIGSGVTDQGTLTLKTMKGHRSTGEVCSYDYDSSFQAKITGPGRLGGAYSEKQTGRLMSCPGPMGDCTSQFELDLQFTEQPQ